MTEHTNIAAALIAAQQAFTPIIKDNKANVGKFSYTYADLGQVLDAVMPALHANGLALMQAMDLRDGQPGIRTVLLFSGLTPMDAIESFTPIYWADKTDTQKYGGAITYCRRYALMALLCLSADDDDGQQARQPAPKRDVVAPDNVNMQTGELAPSTELTAKKQLIRNIAIESGKIGITNDEVKERMRTRFAPDADPETWSREELSVDTLQSALDAIRAQVKKQRVVELGRS